MYSIEEVYKYTGQYDKVASVSFSLGSESQRTFGNYIIGVFKYSKSERESLEVKMRSSPDEKTYGATLSFRFQRVLHLLKNSDTS
jgi:uncharacterized protein YaiE (UPF0345 family)